MKTSTKNDIMIEFNKSIIQHGCSVQRWLQLKSRLSKEDLLLVGDCLLIYWESDLTEGDYNAQRFVASLLFVLNPPTTLPLNSILLGLSKWNLSVEEFPWYLATQFGEERFLHELDILEQESSNNEDLTRAIHTARWWLQHDYRASRSRYE